MKALYLLYAACFAAAFAMASPSRATASSPPVIDAPGLSSEPTMGRCPPTIYECCDGTYRASCTTHGGDCGLFSICGKPV